MRLLLRWRKLCSTMPVKEPATTRGKVPPRPRKTWCDQIKPSLWPKKDFPGQQGVVSCQVLKLFFSAVVWESHCLQSIALSICLLFETLAQSEVAWIARSLFCLPI
jgi:hypothetical protein